MALDWLDQTTTEAIAALFREHGVPGQVSLIPVQGGDEAIFVVGSTYAATMKEAALTTALMNVLKRKVWITTDASAWREKPVPLLPRDFS
jgi:hypothetical protein